MFDIGWTELLVVGVIALIVVGPKELPKMFRTLGQFTAKARNMAREFQRAMEDAADETGVKDVARDLRKATSAKEMGLNELRNFGKSASARKDKDKDKGTDTGKAKPETGTGNDAPSDADGEAAADAELDAVAQEMQKLRTEPAAGRAETEPVGHDDASDAAQATAPTAPSDGAAIPRTGSATEKPATGIENSPARRSDGTRES